MINLFNINNHTIDTSKYSNLLHDSVVTEFENSIAEYVGAKYAVSFNSATSAIFLALQNKKTTITVPSMIPPVVLNAIITSGNVHSFRDDIDWVGDSYILHEFEDYKIVDSAQKIEKNQFAKECNDNDLMVFSHYPTKPIGSCDGGMIVSNDLDKITELRELALNGMSYSTNNWERSIKVPGFKMYMNSIQAEIGLNNLRLYDSKLDRLTDIRETYNAAFELENTSNHLYRLNVINRHTLMDALRYNDINTGIHYESTHMNPVYTIIEEDIHLPDTDLESKHTLSIPFHEKLTDKEVQYIINTIKSKQCLL
jgi:dTDP-4-amino-4,6-dideoxygalactose transaminase